MATTVGSVKFDVDADGTLFERQLRNIAKTAGTSGGHMLTKSFGDAVKKDEGTFERAFRGLAGKFESILKTNKSIRSLSDAWAGLGHNTKQWTLIIGAVAAGMQSIAVLGSAAAAGILVLGGALTGALVGAGALVTAFIGLSGEIDDLPKSVRPAAEAFQALKEPLKELQNFLTERAFAGAEKSFNLIGDTIRKLIPSFGPLGDAIRGIVDSFAEWSASAEGISLLSGLVEKSAPIFDKLVRIAGKLGRALLIAFNNPKFQKAIDDMLTGIGKMFDQFADFVSSDDFGVWIENTGEILGKLGKLIGATSTLFDRLVTPEAYERTGAFLDNLTEFMPHLASLLDILGKLDVFGLIAETLVTLGEALEPLAKPFGDLFEALSNIVSIAIDEWGKNLKPIAEDLAPIVQALADMIADVPPAVIRAIADALFYFATAVVVINGLKFISGAIGLTSFFGSLSKGKGIIGSFPLAKLGKIGGTLAGIALIAAAEIIPDDFWDQFDIESNLPTNVLTGAGIGAMFGGWGIVIGAGIGFITSLFQNWEATLNDSGGGILALFNGTGPFGLFGGVLANFFANLVPEEWRTSDNPLERFAATVAFIFTDTGTTIKLVSEEIGKFFEGMRLGMETWATSVGETWGRTWAALSNPLFWTTIGIAIDAWLLSIRLSFENQLNQVGARWSAWWVSVSVTVGVYVGVIANQVGLFFATLRMNFVIGLVGALASWTNFWNSVPNAVSAAVGRVTNLVNNLMGVINRALGGVNKLAGVSLRGAGTGGNGGGSFASGGILGGPRRVLAGESGPEAIVPLRRNLSQVDPSVRWLSALAQGRTPAMGSGGVVNGGGRSILVEPGAIVVQEAVSGLATGVEVLNRLTAKLV